MLEDFKNMYAFLVNKDLPSFRGPFNQFYHMRYLLETEFTEVVGPNSDRLFSTSGLDLDTEPIVMSVLKGDFYLIFRVYAEKSEFLAGERTSPPVWKA